MTLSDMSMNPWEKYLADIEYDKKTFKDPVQLGVLIHRLIRERELTNGLLKEIKEALEEIRAGLKVLVQEKPELIEISERDREILEFVKEKGKVSAMEVRERFGYKGLNGASARLNHLEKLGLLRKVRVGRKVYFYPSPGCRG